MIFSLTYHEIREKNNDQIFVRQYNTINIYYIFIFLVFL